MDEPKLQPSETVEDEDVHIEETQVQEEMQIQEEHQIDPPRVISSWKTI